MNDFVERPKKVAEAGRNGVESSFSGGWIGIWICVKPFSHSWKSWRCAYQDILEGERERARKRNTKESLKVAVRSSASKISTFIVQIVRVFFCVHVGSYACVCLCLLAHYQWLRDDRCTSIFICTYMYACAWLSRSLSPTLFMCLWEYYKIS